MHRFFGLLAILAAAFGLWVLFSGPDPELSGRGAHAAAGDRDAYGGWALGLLMGLVLAWAATIDWRNMPARLSLWMRLQRRRLGLIVLGGLFAGILLLL